MSGHSKWHSIKHKKGAEDVKRGKIFSKHSKLISIAARHGGDPDMNPGLRIAIENARAENMPRDNIERAIKKGTGDDKSAVQMEEVFYEGRGPGGIALFIETLTDNKNRTVTNLKYIFGKNGGNLGAAGSVGYLFKKRGILNVKTAGKNPEDIELAAIDAGAEDVNVEGDTVEIYTDPSELMKVRGQLESAGIKAESASLIYLPQNEVPVHDEETAKKILNLVDAIEEDEDVSSVYSNFDIPENILEKILS